ncbi:hypothetical protein V7183_21675 [Bacillus sp. JJ1127]|uniref:hypothetical protein n=1 Tax=Bacillus sp. JJ1127 TaxID=3122952 RepID=UPI00300095CE
MSRNKKLQRLTDRRFSPAVQVVLNQFGDKLDLCVDYCVDIQLLIEEYGKLTKKNLPILGVTIHAHQAKILKYPQTIIFIFKIDW